MDTVRSSSDDDPTLGGTPPGAIAFIVEGAIRCVPEKALAPFADGSPTLESITFGVESTTRSDGGSGNDVVFEFSLLGYGIAIRRNGTIEITTRGSVTDIGLP